MKRDLQIEQWAHMLDESFSKTNSSEATTENIIPKDENTKFKFEDVFTDSLDSDEKVEQMFDAIWPKWYDYFINTVNKEKDLELEGRRRDVDDWDVWRISVADCYGGVEKMIELMFDDLYGRWDNSKETTLKEIIDAEIERLVEEARDNISIDELEERGVCIYKGHMHWGGHYPG